MCYNLNNGDDMINNYIKKTIGMILYNFKTLVIFELIYKLLISLVFLPLSLTSLKLIMKITHHPYLTLDNILSFIINPITIIYLLIIIIFLTLVTLYDIANLIYIFDASYHKKKIKLLNSINMSYKKCKSLFKPNHFMIIFFILLLLPFLHIVLESNLIVAIKIPKFITDYITKRYIFALLYFIIYVVIVIILSNMIYSLHYMILENKDYNEAKIASKNLIKNKRIIDIIKILMGQILIGLVSIIVILLGISLLSLLFKILNTHMIIKSILITINWIFIAVILIVSTIISNGVSYAIISSLFYKHKKDNKEAIKVVKYDNRIKQKKNNKLIKIIIIIISIISFIGTTYITYRIITNDENYKIILTKDIEITAHRGASYNYPENTMAAFIGAKDMGANYIELDIQQTKDRKLVVSHDASLNRLAKVNKKIINMTYDEIKKVDVGSYFSDEFKGEGVPLLSDVLKFAKENNIKLNIELKPNGKEVDFEQQTIDMIKKYDMQDNCVVASLKYKTVEKVKQLDSSITTVFVTSVVIGNITDAISADIYSIQSSSINENLVEQIHQNNKKIYAWTVNDIDTVNKMINYDVDNIITDNIELTKGVINERKSSTLYQDIINQLLN